MSDSIASSTSTGPTAAPCAPIDLESLPGFLDHVKALLPPLPDVQVVRLHTQTRALCALKWQAVLQIEFEDLSYSVRVPVLGHGVDSIGTSLVKLFVPQETATRAVLSKCSGVFSPGTLTLVRPCYPLLGYASVCFCLTYVMLSQVLGPPRCGKSSLMKVNILLL